MDSNHPSQFRPHTTASEWTIRLDKAVDKREIKTLSHDGKVKKLKLDGPQGHETMETILRISEDILRSDLTLEELSLLKRAHQQLYEMEQTRAQHAALSKGPITKMAEAITKLRLPGKEEEKAHEKSGWSQRLQRQEQFNTRIQERERTLQAQNFKNEISAQIDKRRSLKPGEQRALLKMAHKGQEVYPEIKKELDTLLKAWADEIYHQLNKIEELSPDDQFIVLDLASQDAFLGIPKVQESAIQGQNKLKGIALAKRIENRSHLGFAEKMDLLSRIRDLQNSDSYTPIMILDQALAQWQGELEEQLENANAHTLDELTELLTLSMNGLMKLNMSAPKKFMGAVNEWETLKYGGLVDQIASYTTLDLEGQCRLLDQLYQVARADKFGWPSVLENAMAPWNSDIIEQLQKNALLNDEEITTLYTLVTHPMMKLEQEILDVHSQVELQIQRRLSKILAQKIDDLPSLSAGKQLVILDEAKARKEIGHPMEEVNRALKELANTTQPLLKSLDKKNLKEQQGVNALVQHPLMHSLIPEAQRERCHQEVLSRTVQEVIKGITGRESLSYAEQVAILDHLTWLNTQGYQADEAFNDQVEQWQQEVRGELQNSLQLTGPKRRDLLALANHPEMAHSKLLFEQLLLAEIRLLDVPIEINLLPVRSQTPSSDRAESLHHEIAIRKKLLRDLAHATPLVIPQAARVDSSFLLIDHFSTVPATRAIPEANSNIDLSVAKSWIEQVSQHIPDPYIDEGSTYPRHEIIKKIGIQVDTLITEQSHGASPPYQTPVKALSHFIEHVHKEQKRIDNIANPVKREREQQDLNDAIKQVVCDHMIPGSLHCIDRLNLEWEKVYFERINTSASIQESLVEEIQKRAATLRADIFEAVITQVAYENARLIAVQDVASFARVAREQLGSHYGVSHSGEFSPYTETFLRDVKKLASEIDERFNEAYTPQRLTEMIEDTVSYTAFHEWLEERFDSSSFYDVQDYENSPLVQLLNDDMDAPNTSGALLLMQETGFIAVVA